ncbi:hypothetical protein CRN44_19675 [Vibrio vulnificus]|nr:hypothetical protein CRN45_20655 [Vibrio vulnificus]POC58829.1 hypothetical protein CRN44_19675 [Vibrio vulnificus]
MKLISLQLVGKGKQGWSSEELHFGEHITHLWGLTAVVKHQSYSLLRFVWVSHVFFDRISTIMLITLF